MLIENEFLKIYLVEEEVFMSVKKLGYSLKDLSTITASYPRLKLSSFAILQKALTVTGNDSVIGYLLPFIDINISNDHLTAEAIVRCTEDEFLESKQSIVLQIENEMKNKGILVKGDYINKNFTEPFKPFVVAKGVEPIAGADATIHFIERPERKPIIREDGSANHYEMNFVYQVEKDQWLGEKIKATAGTNGQDVFGKAILAPKGKDRALKYDNSTIYEVEEDHKISIYALHSGTVEMINEQIRVNQLLEIKGDVGPKTGNVTFDGSIHITGTIMPGYSVIATGDISVDGSEGVTNAEKIQSSGGDIYIKGGIFGNDKSFINAYGNIYLKHANNCKIVGRNLHVGFYLLGCDVYAEEILVNQYKGKIIGGHTKALFKVESAIIGNEHERKTIVEVNGIDKAKYQKAVQDLALELSEKTKMLEKITEHTSLTDEQLSIFSYEQKQKYEQLLETKEQLKAEIRRLNQEIYKSLYLINIQKEPEVHVLKKVYPGVRLEVGKSVYSISEETAGVYKMKK